MSGLCCCRPGETWPALEKGEAKCSEQRGRCAASVAGGVGRTDENEREPYRNGYGERRGSTCPATRTDVGNSRSRDGRGRGIVLAKGSDRDFSHNGLQSPFRLPQQRHRTALPLTGSGR